METVSENNTQYCFGQEQTHKCNFFGCENKAGIACTRYLGDFMVDVYTCSYHYRKLRDLDWAAECCCENCSDNNNNKKKEDIPKTDEKPSNVQFTHEFLLHSLYDEDYVKKFDVEKMKRDLAKIKLGVPTFDYDILDGNKFIVFDPHHVFFKP